MTDTQRVFAYGTASMQKLNTCHPEIRHTMVEGLKVSPYDITIIWGFREKHAQNEAFAKGASTKQWPNSSHNVLETDGDPLSDAVDFAPWCILPNGLMGIPWDDTHAFAVIGGILLATSIRLGYSLRYGGDWDMDGLTTDQILMDWGHLERVRLIYNRER